MDSTAEASAHPAPHSRACLNCSRSKAKCVTAIDRGAGSKCERCHRLNKDCQAAPNARKRKAIKTATTNKTALLEQKLDGLVMLLKSANLPSGLDFQGPSNTGVIPPEQNFGATFPPMFTGPLNERPQSGNSCGQMMSQNVHGRNRTQWQAEDLANSPRHYMGGVPTPTDSQGDSASRPRFQSGHSTPSLLMHEPAEAEKVLREFRMRLISYFPFFSMSDSVNAEEFCKEYPFFYRCIMAVSAKSSTKQIEIEENIRLDLGRMILVDGDKNLDLLLGILTYSAWCHYHYHTKPLLTTLLQIAMALVFELGLNKPPSKEETKRILLNIATSSCGQFIMKERTIEERRAYVGCFFLSSAVAAQFQKLDPMRRTPYLEECVKILSENKTCLTDVLFAQLVQLQFITDSVQQAPWHDVELSKAARAPTHYYLKLLQTQLDDVKKNIPIELADHTILQLHIHSADLIVHEISIVKSALLSDFQRLDTLWICLTAVASFFEIIFTLSPNQCLNFPLTIFTQTARALVALYKLTVFEDPNWDRALVRQTLDISILLGKLSQRMAEVPRGGQGGKEIFTETSLKLSRIKKWWDAKAMVDTLGHEVTTTVDETMVDVPLDVLDYDWVNDLLGTWDYRFEGNGWAQF